MRIKRLELNGFKSFARRTCLEFSPGISGIVGPNGCGKSNIVDAIRWTLGEQSPKVLRGKMMQDVIFAGTETMRPLGLSQIIITFDVDGAEISAPYKGVTELEIGRRLYRSGISEYFINRNPCRLKDITNLFMDTGAGKRAYSIIEQGKVNEIIGAKPEEMRYFIEEAAGIGKYRSKREETLQKIESATINLNQVTVVMEEMKRQLNSLHRQMKKAERYRTLMGELRDIERSLLLHEYETLVVERESFDVEYRKYHKLKSGLEEELALIKKERVVLEDRMVSLESRADELRKRISDNLNKMKTLDATYQNSIGEFERASSTIKYLGQELPVIEKKWKDTHILLSKIEGSVEETQRRIRDEEDNLKKIQSELSRCNEKKTEIESSLKGLRERSFITIVEISNKKNQLRNMEKRREELKYLIEKKRETLKVMDEKLSSYVRHIDSMKSTLKEKNDELKEFANSMSGMNERLKGLISSITEKENELSSVKTGLLQLTSKLESLRELDRRLEGLGDGTKAILKNERIKTEISGILSDFIEVSGEYEEAVSSILGEILEYIIIKKRDSATDALTLLKNKGSGRCGFIPLDVRRRPTKKIQKKIPVDSGVIGDLRSLIKLPLELEEILEGLLDDILLVRDIEKGLNIFDECKWEGDIVTLDGDILFRSGILCGGGRSSRSNLLTRKKEILELEKVVSIEGVRVKKLDEELEAIYREREETMNLLDEMKIKEDKLKDEISLVERQLLNAEAEMKMVKREISLERAEIERSEEEAKNLIDDIDRIQNELSIIEEENKKIDKKLHEEEARLEESVQGVDEIKKKISMIRETIALLNEREAGDMRERARLQNELQEYEKRREERLREYEKSSKTLLASKEIIESIRGQIVRLEKEKEKFQRNLSKVEGKLWEVRKKVEETRQRERVLDDNYTIIRSKAQELELKRSQVEFKLSSVIQSGKDRLNEDITEHYREGIIKDRRFLKGQNEVQELKERASTLRSMIDQLGEVNLYAISEYEQLNKRYEFMADQKEDLLNSIKSLKETISRINRISVQRFKETFDSVNEVFQSIFPKLFAGGSGRLLLENPDNLLETGVYVMAQPPGKKLQNMNLLSGGEKALGAIGLIFSLFMVKPSPFCILDEVEAALDDVNIDRFNFLVKEMSKRSQIIIITHNKRTMEIMDNLYGITMEEPGISKVVSVKLSNHEITS